MTILHTIRKLFWPLGLDIQRFDPLLNPMARKNYLLKHYSIDTVLDVGANTGQYVYDIRSNFGFDGTVLSFEPLQSAYRQFEQNASHDSRWRVYNYALGNTDGTMEMNISENSQSSSLLGMDQQHIHAAPDSRYKSKEMITVHRLDTVFGAVCPDAKNIYMKLDTQGYESFVLNGATESLQRIHTVQMELSTIELYKGQMLLPEMVKTMTSLGYHLVAIESGFYSPEGKILQLDGIFHRYPD